jgi:hypothetical protein
MGVSDLIKALHNTSQGGPSSYEECQLSSCPAVSGKKGASPLVRSRSYHD